MRTQSANLSGYELVTLILLLGGFIEWKILYL